MSVKFENTDREFCLPVMSNAGLKKLSPILPENVTTKLPVLDDIKCVLFDVYGTLFISSVGDISLSDEDSNASFLEGLVEKYLGPVPKPPNGLKIETLFKQEIISFQNHLRDKGVSNPEVEIREVWKNFLSSLGYDALNTEVICSLATEYECISNKCFPMPHLEETIQSLISHGFLVGIISNAQFYTQALFKHFLGKWPEKLGFSPELSYWSYEFLEGKPSLAKYEKAKMDLRELFQVKPEQVAYVGNDMRNDVYPADTVGFNTFLFAGDQRSLRMRKEDDRCENLLPTGVITNLAQLLECIDS